MLSNRRPLALVPLLVLALAAIFAARAPADTLLVANKADATLSLIDLETGEVAATLPTGDGPHEVAVSPDGRRALVTDYGTRGAPGSTLTLVDVAGARVLDTIELGRFTRPHGILWLDDHRAVVTAEGAKSLVTVDVDSGEVVSHVETGQEVSHMVAVAPGGDRAYVTNLGSGSTTAIDLAEGKVLGTVETGAGTEGVAVTPDGSQVWVTNREAGTVSLIDPARLEVVTTLPSEGFPIRAEVTPDGRWVLVTNARAGDLTVIDTEKREVARRLALEMEVEETEGRLFGDRFGDSSVPIGIEISRDGKRAWIAHAQADAIQVLDLESWEPAGRFRAGHEPDGMAYSPLEVEVEEEGE